MRGPLEAANDFVAFVSMSLAGRESPVERTFVFREDKDLPFQGA
jgi:hypothetical protein